MRPFGLLLPVGSLLLLACGGRSGRESGLEWNGEPLPVAARAEKPAAEALRGMGLDALAERTPRRVLSVAPGEWGDSLKLLGFGGEPEAYAAFQELAAHPGDIASGLTVCGDRVCFRRGRWIGLVDAWSWKGEDWFANALSLPGAALPGGLPAAFGSLLHQGRIPGSERVLTGEFMGMAIAAPVFSVRADCRGDTAWVYAAPQLRASFAETLARAPGWHSDTTAAGIEISSELTDLPPIVLRFSAWGMVGVEGCFDDNLTKYWLKMQGRGLKNLK